MRITRIIPSLFGRFTTPKQLDIPDASMVVVYGENETGKSTYADLAVTLLSDKYDSDVLEKYGVSGAPIKGRIELADDGSALSVEFMRDAVVPQRNTAVKKQASDQKSRIWARIRSLESEIVRNLFRLNAVEIEDGTRAKEKFKNYGLGDRRGISIASVIASYRANVTAQEGNIRTATGQLSDLKDELRDANQSGPQYRALLGDIEASKKLRAEHQAELRTLETTGQALAVCSALDTTTREARDAEGKLKVAAENGALVPLSFGAVHTSIKEAAKSLGTFRLDTLHDELTSRETELTRATEKVESGLRVLGLDRDRLLTSPILAEQQPRIDFLSQLQGRILQRDNHRIELETLNGQNNTVEVNAAEERAKDADQAWSDTGVSITAHEFAARPEVLDVPQSSSSTVRSGPAPWVFGALGAVGALACALVGQIIGAIVSVALGVISYFALRQALHRSSIPDSDDETRVDRDLLHQLAQEVIQSRAHLEQTERFLKGVRDRIPVLQGEISRLDSDVHDPLVSVGLNIPVGISLSGLNSIFENIAGLVTGASSLKNLAFQRDEVQTTLETEQEKFRALRDRLISDFQAGGIDIDAARVQSPADAIVIIEDWCGRWENQSECRTTVARLEQQIVAQPHLTERIRELLAMDSTSRQNVSEQTRESAERIDGEITDLTTEITEWETEALTLSTTSRIADLHARISAKEAELEEARLESMRLRTQIRLVESLAKRRAEESKPELVRRVQEMVLAVADDWKAIEFDESGDSVAVEYKSGGTVGDVALSAGARSLLFIAMRTAIMQRESEGESGIRIPLFCDDPLLHLDDKRTRQAMRMLRDQSAGHQIIYFTCKNEIRNLAGELGIPVVTLS